MLTLRLFLIILVTLLCREVCWQSEAPIEPLEACLSIMAICIGYAALAKVLCVLGLRKVGAFDDYWPSFGSDLAIERWHRTRQTLETVWLLSLPVTLMWASWGPWVKQLDQAGALQSVTILLWFLPSLLALVALELTTSQMEVYLQTRKLTIRESVQMVVTPKYQGVERRAHLIQVIDASHSTPPRPQQLSKVLGTRIRLGGTSNVMACLLPVLLIAAAGDLLTLLRVDWPESIQSLLASAIGLSVVALFMPQWLSRWMGVTKLQAGSLRERVEVYCKRVGVVAEPMWVSSDGRWAGAAVVGWLPGFRQLWLGDALVEQLTNDETDMVVMHELAHLKRRHFLWRLLPVLAACLIGMATVSLFSATSSYAPAESSFQIVGQLTGMILACGVMLHGISYWSRSCELDADRTACQLAISTCEWARSEPGSAALALSNALLKLHRGSDTHDRATWLHPALRVRLEKLASLLPVAERVNLSGPMCKEDTIDEPWCARPHHFSSHSSASDATKRELEGELFG